MKPLGVAYIFSRCIISVTFLLHSTNEHLTYRIDFKVILIRGTSFCEGYPHRSGRTLNGGYQRKTKKNLGQSSKRKNNKKSDFLPVIGLRGLWVQ